MHQYREPRRLRPAARPVSRILAVAFVGLAVCSTAWAEELDPPAVTGFGVALDSEALDALRGGDVDNHLRNNGLVSDNHAENVNSGTNTLTGSAFANASGISTVIQNSGSNVLIQNAMIINVQFTGSGP